MGLSKKLGAVAAPKVDSVVPYKWSTQTYTVQEIIHKFKLPCVVQCATGKFVNLYFVCGLFSFVIFKNIPNVILTNNLIVSHSVKIFKPLDVYRQFIIFF